MDNMFDEATKQQATTTNGEGGIWGRLNAAYNTNEWAGDFAADYYWPTKERKLPESDLVVEIIGAKIHTENETSRLLFHLRLPDRGKTAIKSCRLAPESMRFLRMDMERIGIHVDDIRKLGPAIKALYNKPIQARLYFNEKTGWQDVDFMGLVTTNAQPEIVPSAAQTVTEPEPIDWGM